MTALLRGSILSLLLLSASAASAQIVGQGSEKARPVTGDPGMSSMTVVDLPNVRVLRNHAEPGAVRRMHSHPEATYHVLTLITGTLKVTVEGEAPIEVRQGDVVTIKAGSMHSFQNPGTVTATMVEVVGRVPAAATKPQ
jgi:quercetin dioxygenase-like cupin family protein